MITDSPGSNKHDIRCGAGGVGRPGDGNSGVGFFQGGGIVHAVARHGHDVVGFLQAVHDVVLVFGKDLGKAAGFLDQLDNLRLVPANEPIVRMQRLEPFFQLPDHVFADGTNFVGSGVRA